MLFCTAMIFVDLSVTSTKRANITCSISILSLINININYIRNVPTIYQKKNILVLKIPHGRLFIHDDFPHALRLRPFTVYSPHNKFRVFAGELGDCLPDISCQHVMRLD